MSPSEHSFNFQSVRFYSLPPHTVLPLPALSPTMETGTIAKWELKEGDSFEVGDLLAEIETDKATLGFEAADDGFLAKILVPAGSKNITIGAPVAIVVQDASHISSFANYTSPPETSSAPPAPETSSAPPAPKAAAPKPASSYPIHSVVDLPALSPTMTSGSLVSWEAKVGDKIEEGDSIATIETDKASVALEIQDEGYLAKIMVSDGSKDLPLGTPLCVIVENEKDVAAFANYVAGDSASGQSAEPAAEPEPVQQPAAVQRVAAPTPSPTQQSAPTPSTDRIFASPLARKLAAERGIPISQFKDLASGPDGRIVAADLDKEVPVAPQVATAAATTPAAAQPVHTPVAAAASPVAVSPSNAAYQDIDVTNVRKVIASRLSQSKQTIPHYYLTAEIEMDKILEVRKTFNENNKGGSKLSVNDFIIKASALSCMKVPETNSSWNETFIREYKTVDMSIAVSTDNGLITPIVFDAQTKGLSGIAGEVKDLAVRARDGKLKPEEFMGGTFTISNLGMFGVSHFSAVINPPQSCILAVGSARRELVPGKDDEVRVATMMSVTLSCDHRVVDGAVGATWLQHFKSLMENPITMLL